MRQDRCEIKFGIDLAMGPNSSFGIDARHNCSGSEGRIDAMAQNGFSHHLGSGRNFGNQSKDVQVGRELAKLQNYVRDIEESDPFLPRRN